MNSTIALNFSEKRFTRTVNSRNRLSMHHLRDVSMTTDVHRKTERQNRRSLTNSMVSRDSIFVRVSLLLSSLLGLPTFTSGQVLFSCTFENDTWPCRIFQDPTGQFNWLLYSGKTPTDGTGPDEGQGRSLFYFYIESSDPRQPNDQARFSTLALGVTGDVCVRFYYYAYGEGVGQLILYTQVGSDYNVQHSEWWRLRGDQGPTWRYEEQDIYLNSTDTRVGWNGVRGMSFLGDIGVDTIRITQGSCTPPVTLPWSCDFEADDICGMRQRPDDDFDWFRQSGPTPTPGTGPPGSQSGSYYVYVESSNVIAPGTKAAVESPALLYSGEACVSFWYSLYGSSIGNLSVYTLNAGGQGRPWWTRSSPTARDWTQANITVTLTSNTDRVGFLGVRGSDIYGDIAIDNVQVRQGACGTSVTTSAPTTMSASTTAVTTTSATTAPTTTTAATTATTTTTATTRAVVTTDPTAATTKPTPVATTPDFTNLPHVYLPWSCDFEFDQCQLEQLNYVNYVWTRWFGPAAPTGQTGPQSAQSGQYYMFLNSSAPRKLGDNALLETPYIVYSGSCCFRCWLYMFGRDVGRVFLYTSGPGRSFPWRIWSGDMGPRWFLVEETIPLVYDRIGIIAEVGNGPFGYIAIDNITITAHPCNYIEPNTTSSQAPPTITTAITTATAASATTATATTTATTTANVNSPSFQYPYIRCDMEGDGSSFERCRLRQATDDSFDWTGMSGQTPSGQLSTRVVDGVKYPVTGPTSSEEGRYYLYTEATNTVNGQVARLIAEGLDFARRPRLSCLRFYFEMNGFHTGTLAVFSRTNGGPRQTQWQQSGDKGPLWRKASIDFNMTDVTEIGIEAVMAGEFSGDIAIDNLALFDGQCQRILWTCRFELADGSSTMCGMTTPSGSVFEWTLWEGHTPSEETGPSRAYSLPYFIYAEASEPRVQGDTAEIQIPSLYATEFLCLSFYYNMNGFHMGTLQVYIVDRGNAVTLWTLSGNHGDQWLTANVSIPSQYDTKIGFRGIRGDEFSGDIAIDNISVFRGGCSGGIISDL